MHRFPTTERTNKPSDERRCVTPATSKARQTTPARRRDDAAHAATPPLGKAPPTHAPPYLAEGLALEHLVEDGDGVDGLVRLHLLEELRRGRGAGAGEGCVRVGSWVGRWLVSACQWGRGVGMEREGREGGKGAGRPDHHVLEEEGQAPSSFLLLAGPFHACANVPPAQSMFTMGFPSSEPVMAFMASVPEFITASAPAFIDVVMEATSGMGWVCAAAGLLPPRRASSRTAPPSPKSRERMIRMLSLSLGGGVFEWDWSPVFVCVGFVRVGELYA